MPNEILRCDEHPCCILFTVPRGRLDLAGDWHLRWSREKSAWTISKPDKSQKTVPVTEGHPVAALINSYRGVSFADAQPSLPEIFETLDCP